MTQQVAEHTPEFWLDFAEKAHYFDKDDENEFPFLVLMGALENGVDLDRVRSWLGKRAIGHIRQLKHYWKLAIENRIFVGDKISVEDPEKGPDSVEIILWVMCLRGLTERVAKC